MKAALLTLALLATALPSPLAWTQDTSKETSKLAAFEPFIGTWAFTSEFTTANEWARDFHAEILDWGPRKNTVRMRETVRKDDPQRLVYEGFAYWHPTEDKLKYVGYNVQERFLFEGEIVALERNRMVTEYRVYYPPGYQHGAYGDVKGDVREYRGERKLLTPNTLEHKTFMKIEGRWVPWPAADAKPFVVERAGAAAVAAGTEEPATQPATAEDMQVLAPYIGEFRSVTQVFDDGKTDYHHRIRYEWFDEKKLVVKFTILMVIPSRQREIVTAQGFYGHDAPGKKIHVFGAFTNGTIGWGSLGDFDRRSGARTVFARSMNPDGTITHVRDQFEVIDGNRWKNTTRIRKGEDGEWQLVHEGIYTRVTTPSGTT